MFVSQLLGKKIKTISGKELDHIQNIELLCEVKSKKQKAKEATHLVYGKRGFLDRFIGKKGKQEKVPWKDVVNIGNEFVIVKKV